MLIPSIDFLGGIPVQLRGGNPNDKLFDNLGDPSALFRKFQVAGQVALVDLDAALGRPDSGNEKIIEKLIRDNQTCKVIVGGGIRSIERAHRWLNLGASKIVIGTAATPEFLSQLPKERVIVALDSQNGQVVHKGWTEQTGKSVLEKIEELRNFTSGFLFTFVEIEGRLTGIPEDRVIEVVRPLVDSGIQIIVAGGAKTSREVGRLDLLGADVQVGLALHTGDMNLGEAIASCVRGNDLTPTLVTDESGLSLGLVYSTRDSLALAINRGQGIYHSRRRGLWVKGEESGNTQKLLNVSLDCDRDTIKVVVHQKGVFCHKETCSCFEGTEPSGLNSWAEKVFEGTNGTGYTARVFNDKSLLNGKLLEEAKELCDAQTADEAIQEFLDVLYFGLIKVFSLGGTWSSVLNAVAVRNRWVSHRQGKPPRV